MVSGRRLIFLVAIIPAASRNGWQIKARVGIQPASCCYGYPDPTPPIIIMQTDAKTAIREIKSNVLIFSPRM